MWCQLSRHEAVLTTERPYNRRQSRTKIDKERSVAAKTTRKLTFVACFLSLHRITKQRRAEPELHPSSPLHFFFTRLFPVLTPTAPKSQPKLTPKINCEFQLFVIQLPFLAVFYHLCDILTEEINIKDPKPSISPAFLNLSEASRSLPSLHLCLSLLLVGDKLAPSLLPL